MDTDTRRSPVHRFNRLLCWALVPIMWLSVTAANAALSCTASVASIPELDPDATAAELGELTLACSGGVETDPLPLVNFQSFFNVSLLQDVAPVLSDGTTDYLGTFSGANSIAFPGVPINPFASLFTFDQVFVNPGLLAADQLIIQFLSVTGAIAVPVDNPQQLVGVIGTANTVPEPATLLLLAAACAGLWLRLPRHGRLGARAFLRPEQFGISRRPGTCDRP
jgi:hypothetical protein